MVTILAPRPVIATQASEDGGAVVALPVDQTPCPDPDIAPVGRHEDLRGNAGAPVVVNFGRDEPVAVALIMAQPGHLAAAERFGHHAGDAAGRIPFYDREMLTRDPQAAPAGQRRGRHLDLASDDEPTEFLVEQRAVEEEPHLGASRCPHGLLTYQLRSGREDPCAIALSCTYLRKPSITSFARGT